MPKQTDTSPNAKADTETNAEKADNPEHVLGAFDITKSIVNLPQSMKRDCQCWMAGATGWRIGMIATYDNNVVDRLLKELPEKDREYLANEYALISDEPDTLPFRERIVADSRSIGLYHTTSADFHGYPCPFSSNV